MAEQDNLFELFVAEAKEHLEISEECLLRLGRQHDDDDALQSCFRALHSLKGCAAFFELTAVMDLAHGCEHVLDRIRSGERAVEPAVIDVLLRAVSHLGSNFGRLEAQGQGAPQQPATSLIEELTACWQEQGATSALPAATPGPATPSMAAAAARLPASDSSVMEDVVQEASELLSRAEELLLAEGDLSAEPIREVFRSFHTLKGISAYVGLADVEARTHLAEAMLMEGSELLAEIDEATRAELVASIDDLRRMLNVSASGEHRVPRLGDLLVAEGLPRTQVEAIAAALEPGQRLGEEVVASGLLARDQVERAVAQQASMRRSGEGYTRVATGKLEDLVNLVGELMIAQAMVAAHPAVLAAPQLKATVVRQSRIVRDVQGLALSLRMVPMRSIFRKMARVVHDVARKLGRQLEFRMEGEDTEIDRTLAEVIADPLLHMMRNAVDHGIEGCPARGRWQQGGAPRGDLLLRAEHSGDQVLITIEDDGRGLDAERIRAKAIERGLIAEGAQLSLDEASRLIFLPGFSTAAEINEISGRGVGLDVVQRNVLELKGTIEVSSRKGHGTRFLIRLPLTTAILDTMLLRVGEERFLLPVGCMVEALHPQAGDIKTVLGRGRMIESRGQMLPLVDLDRLFGIESKSGAGMVVVVDILHGRLALVADDVLGQQQVLIKPIAPGVGHHAGIAGSAILADGRVGLLLDPARISLGEHAMSQQSGPGARPMSCEGHLPDLRARRRGICRGHPAGARAGGGAAGDRDPGQRARRANGRLQSAWPGRAGDVPCASASACRPCPRIRIASSSSSSTAASWSAWRSTACRRWCAWPRPTSRRCRHSASTSIPLSCRRLTQSQGRIRNPARPGQGPRSRLRWHGGGRGGQPMTEPTLRLAMQLHQLLSGDVPSASAGCGCVGCS